MITTARNHVATRRSFITGLISLVAAPAIVRAGSLMPVKAIIEPVGTFNVPLDPTDCIIGDGYITEVASMTRKAFLPQLFVQTYKVDPLLQKLLESGA
jgi:hypothetical protein